MPLILGLTLIYVAVGLLVYDTHSFECNFSLSSYIKK